MKTKNLFLAVIIVLAFGFVSCKNDTETKEYWVTFEDVALGENGYWNGDDLSGTPETVPESWGEVTYYHTSFTSGVAEFDNKYSTGYWDGFACSSLNDTLTDNYTNLSSIAGEGANSKKYAIAYQPYDRDLFFEIKKNESGYFNAASIMLANSTYAYLYMKNNFKNDDWLKLTITGYKNSQETTSLDYYLADFRNDKKILSNKWEKVDISVLGEVDKIILSFETNDYMAPTYVCIDNILFTQEIEK